MNINLPGRVIKGQAVSASWANSIREAIARLARNDIPQGRTPREQRSQVPFRVSGITMNADEEYTVAVYPGYVVGSNPAVGADPVFVYHMPEIDGVPLDAEETPELAVEKDKTVYLLVTTNDKDIIQSVEIVLDDPDKAGLHHHPPPNATVGEYYYPLADIEEVEIPDPPEGSPSTRLVVTNRRQLPSPFIHRQLLVELRNKGTDDGGRPIFSENTGDIYDLRSLKQLEGGVPCIKPLDEAVPPLVDEDNNLVLDPETGEPVEEGRPAEEEGDTIKFKAFRVQTGVPCEFDDQEDINELKFTGATGAVDNAFINIATVNGLVTLIADGDGVGGKNLNLTVETLDYFLGSGDVMVFLAFGSPVVHYWRDGLYIGTTDPEDAPDGLISQTVTQMRLSS
jgi:hypothetical protein